MTEKTITGMKRNVQKPSDHQNPFCTERISLSLKQHRNGIIVLHVSKLAESNENIAHNYAIALYRQMDQPNCTRKNIST